MDAWPFSLFLCRPSRLWGDFGVYATVTVGLSHCEVHYWPFAVTSSLPSSASPASSSSSSAFPAILRTDDLVTILIYRAQDATAFAQGRGRCVGACFLPLWELPQTLGASKSEGVWDLEMALIAELDDILSGSMTLGESLSLYWSSVEEAKRRRQLPRLRVLIQARPTVLMDFGSSLSPFALASGSVSDDQMPSRAQQQQQQQGLDPPEARLQSLEESELGDGTDLLLSPPAIPRLREKFAEEVRKCDRFRRQAALEADRKKLHLSALERRMAYFFQLESSEFDTRLMSATLSSWRAWLWEQKSTRQFGQVHEDLECLEQDSVATREAFESEMAALDVEAFKRRDAERSSQLRWEQLLGGLQSLGLELDGKELLDLLFSFWRTWQGHRQALKRMLLGFLTGYASPNNDGPSSTDSDIASFLQVILQLWRSQVGGNRAEDLLRRLEDERGLLQRKLRVSVTSRLWEASQQRVVATSAKSCLFARFAFCTWRDFARDHSEAWASPCLGPIQQVRAAVNFASTSPTFGQELALLALCFSVWRGLAASKSLEATTSQVAVRKRRNVTGIVLRAAVEAKTSMLLRCLWLTWRAEAQSRSLVSALENAHNEQMEDYARCQQAESEVEELQILLEKEELRSLHVHESLVNQLELLRSEGEAAEASLQTLCVQEELESVSDLEILRCVEGAASRLRHLEAEAEESSQKLIHSEVRQFALEEESYEEQAELENHAGDIFESIKALQAEERRQRERFERSQRHALREVRASLQSTGAASLQCAESLEQEQQTLDRRVAESHQKVEQLEAEVQQLRTKLKKPKQPGRPSVFSEREATLAKMTEEAEEAERLAQEAEEAERARKQQLQHMRLAFEELTARQLHLEQLLSMASLSTAR